MTPTQMELNELSLWEAPEGTVPPTFGVEPDGLWRPPFDWPVKVELESEREIDGPFEVRSELYSQLDWQYEPPFYVPGPFHYTLKVMVERTIYVKPIKGATFQEKLDYDMAMWRSRGYHLDTRNAVTFEEDTESDERWRDAVEQFSRWLKQGRQGGAVAFVGRYTAELNGSYQFYVPKAIAVDANTVMAEGDKMLTTCLSIVFKCLAGADGESLVISMPAEQAGKPIGPFT